jgi:hypothetical protein
MRVGPTMSKQKRKPRNKFKPVVDGSKPALKGTALSVSAHVIRAGKSKGTRKRGKGEFTQAVLLAIFLEDPSKQEGAGVGHGLVQEVNDRLVPDKDFQDKYPGATVSNMTVARELRKLRQANR